MLDLQEKYVPSWVQTTCRTKLKPWFNGELRRLTGKRNRVYKKFKKNRTSETCQQLETIRTLLQTKIRQAKKEFFNNLPSRFKTTKKLFWNLVKCNEKDGVCIPSLQHDGKEMENSLDKASCLNTFFSSIFSPCSSNSILPTPTNRCMTDMYHVAVDENGIHCLLEHLDPSKAGGLDGLRGGFLKMCAPFIVPFLKVLYSKSLRTGSLPRDWKVACVVPVYKSGPRERVNNYRLISLTSIACKILEHVLCSNVMTHIINQNLNPRLHGFNKGFPI